MPRKNYGCLLLGLLSAIERAALHTLGHAGGIKSTADDVVTYARKVANPAAADQHNAMLLQVVADTGYVAGTLNVVGKADTSDLAQSRKLGRRRVLTDRHTAILQSAPST